MSAIKLLCSAASIAAVSNVAVNQKVEEAVKPYAVIVRFNKGSNPVTQTAFGLKQSRTDVCAIHGSNAEFLRGNFGPPRGFQDKHILFSRPLFCSQQPKFIRAIAVPQQSVDTLKPFAASISYIPEEVFIDIADRYSYTHPSTGLTFVYWVNKFLYKRITCVNFVFNYSWQNVFVPTSYCPHNIELERAILLNLNVQHIITGVK